MRQFRSSPKEGLWLAHCVGVLFGSETGLRLSPALRESGGG